MNTMARNTSDQYAMSERVTIHRETVVGSDQHNEPLYTKQSSTQ